MPIENIDYDQTYCTLTLDIARSTKLMIDLTILNLVLSAFEFLIGDKFSSWLVSRDFKECIDSGKLVRLNWWYWVKVIATTAKIMVSHFINI